MRLLKCATLSFHEFFDANIPPYAILSHTWGEEEVSLQEMTINNGLIRRKSGHEKIKRCCEVALSDGFEYAWVDTCCIDKTSSAELSEAINSMYRWYRQARVCYVILTDVPSDEDPQSPYSCFRHSRWFTRGWTLQELIAPTTVIFHASDWREIGTKATLRSIISEVTSIHTEVLSGEHRIEMYSIAQRMSWASRRHTTRTEDIAYCLMGIFDVNMPLLYGEGDRAFRRLQEHILNASEDDSILAHRPSPPLQDTGSFLAYCPRGFIQCHNVEWSLLDRPISEHNISSRGLLMEVEMTNLDKEYRRWVVLKCRDKTDMEGGVWNGTRVVLHCQEVGFDQRRPQLVRLPQNDMSTLERACLHDEPLSTDSYYLRISRLFQEPPVETGCLSIITITTRGLQEKGYVLQDMMVTDPESLFSQKGVIYFNRSAEHRFVGRLRFSNAQAGKAFDVWLQFRGTNGYTSHATVAISSDTGIGSIKSEDNIRALYTHLWKSIDQTSCDGEKGVWAAVSIRPHRSRIEPLSSSSEGFKVEISWNEPGNNSVYATCDLRMEKFINYSELTMRLP